MCQKSQSPPSGGKWKKTRSGSSMHMLLSMMADKAATLMADKAATLRRLVAPWGYGAFCLAFNYVSALAVIACNKEVFQFFPHPGLLTTIHYLISTMAIEGLFRAKVLAMTPQDLSFAKTPQNLRPFGLLVLAWTLCNVLSNVSLEKNSVGFYQMMKLLVTPTVVVWNYAAYQKRISSRQGLLLAGACAGVWLVTVNDVEVTTYGAIVAFSSVYVTAAQKIANGHLQQQCGMSSFAVMRLAMPLMTLLTAVLFCRSDGLSALMHLALPQFGLVLLSGVSGLCASLSATMVFGAVGVLAHVLLGQIKLCSVLLVGSLFFDKPANGRSKLGAVLAVMSVSAYTVLTMQQQQQSKKKKKDNNLKLPQ